ncbi:MFS transporter [Paenibacillus sp. UNC499MF]|uniref:MFS transporter n=1 Tax=Paenibacillus sp. UNC499MF TaxID=1502751 RepID=UPI00089FCA6A|nr:MFS transporter [Paenibacillus sp. UNC499MF]SEG80053.1 hypothetical protein SAMN02799616_05259 [Paenibacillus sp. UNC499MF]
MDKRIFWLALGGFALGTEGYMIGGLLPTLAAALHVSTALAGQLVTAFALVYAVSSPLLTTLTGRRSVKFHTPMATYKLEIKTSSECFELSVV